MPTPRQLSIFLKAAADGNFRRTAEHFEISQASVSQQIQALERAWGCELFVRRRGAAATLSDSGQEMLAHATASLGAHRSLERAAQTRLRPAAPLRIGIRSYLLHAVMQADFDAFSEVEAGHTRFVIINEVDAIFAALDAGELDLALYRGALRSSRNHRIDILGVSPCSVFGAPALAAQIASGALALEDAPFIMPGNSAAWLSWTLSVLQAAGLTPRNVARTSQFESAIETAVLRGEGIAVFFDQAMQSQLSEGRIARITPPIDQTPIILATRMGLRPTPSPELDRFLSRCVKFLGGSPPVTN
jgi:DNA-binding transcriptional LysR family regulator